jgi:predicted nucleic acid-binding protein
MRGQPLSNEQAWAVWDGFISDERVRLFPELPALNDQFRALSTSQQSSPKIWADAYLAAHAAANDATLVSFDQAIARYNVPCYILS